MKILFMAAGMSSRFGGEPKLLAQIGANYESLLEITLLQIKNHIDISSIHFILNKKSKEIILKEVENIKIKHNLNVNVTYNIQIIPEERIKSVIKILIPFILEKIVRGIGLLDS